MFGKKKEDEKSTDEKDGKKRFYINLKKEIYVPKIVIPIFLLACVCMCVSHSVVSDSSATPWTVARQAPLSMGFSRQEYWSVLPFPSPGDLPNPGIEPMSPALAGKFFTTEPPGNPYLLPCTKVPVLP